MNTPDKSPRPKQVLAVLGQTATGKSALAIALAGRYGGEIINCDSTAVYRGFDIGTDKVPREGQGGIPHHLVDIVEPTEDYTAAQYARDAARVIEEVHARGHLPILVGGTGFYYRALTRGLFPGPGRDAALRDRLRAIARRRGLSAEAGDRRRPGSSAEAGDRRRPDEPFLHRMLRRVDPASAARVQPRDEVRIVRALEVFFLTGRSLTAHFADTVSPLAGWDVIALALTMPAEELVPRLARRVDEQFARGLLDEIRGLLARGVPEDAHPFGGLVYRQALEHLHGVRDEAATRQLIVRENRRYARRQLIWFRKEANLVWFRGAGDAPGTFEQVTRALDAQLWRGPRPGSGAVVP